MDFQRPVLKLIPTKTDLLLDRLALAMLAFLWVYAATNYFSLPEIIPTHFNLKGSIDGYGEKMTMFTLPLIVTIIVAGIMILNHYPHVFNYPTTITAENAEQQYRWASSLMRWLKLVITIVFSIIAIAVVRSAHTKTEGTAWLVPLIVLALSLPTIIYLFKSSKK